MAGIVRDERGAPIVGATVVAKGTMITTTTDASGIFSLQVPPGTNTIVVSSVGFNTAEINGNSGYANVTLKEAVSNLSEVVVTGYSSSNSDGFYDSDRSYKKKNAATPINTTTLYKPTTTVFEIEDPYSVPTDGKTYTADI